MLQVEHRHGSFWQDCYGGVFADFLQFLGDRDCYIRDRPEVHAPDVVGRYLAVEPNSATSSSPTGYAWELYPDACKLNA